MSETHTPGPWRWYGYYLMQDVPAKFEVDADENGKETNPYSTPHGEPIADDGSAGGEYGATIDINGPDARLIAAAPDLLELAKLVAQDTYPRGHRARMTRLARAAIARAGAS